MTEEPALAIVRNHIYRAKKPKRLTLWVYPHDVYDDRMVLYVSETGVQYDSPTVLNNRKYPTIDRAKFEAWAGSDVTDGYPNGYWQEYK
jgi:hypothetical protein